MFSFLGYNFYSDASALDTAPTQINNLTNTQIKNGIFDHFNVTKDIELPFTTEKPEDWDYYTVMNADFNGNVSAGNIDFLLSTISAIKVKRRPKGTFNWTTIAVIPISDDVEDLKFTITDRLASYNVEYDYAFVPIINDIEGNYIINSILSKFDGVFIGDSEQIFKFFYEVEYGMGRRNQQIGTFEPLGKRYPVVVANGMTSYDSNTLTATILNDDFNETGKLDPDKIVQKKRVLLDFLTNKKPKILKDDRGNSWLVIVTSSPEVAYKPNVHMAIPQVSFGWTEVGDYENPKDLYDNGLTPEV